MIGYKTGGKRTKDLNPRDVQQGNQQWWNEHPMTYDWHGEIASGKYSSQWYEAMDQVHIYGARLFATREVPFDRIMPLDRLQGARVLEIGCGMGLHTETLARAGADVTAIDLTPAAVEATSRRLELKGLKAKVMQADAELLGLEANSFDFVWSWGVIHHSANTARIVRNIARVLKPDGECRVMVYNREGTGAKIAFVKDYLLRGGFLRHNFEETLYRSTDGFSARFYVAEQFEDLFRAFFKDVQSEICGLDVDVVPLPNKLRKLALRFVPQSYLETAQAKRGGFIFLKAAKPDF